jgi:hypothetical protein
LTTREKDIVGKKVLARILADFLDTPIEKDQLFIFFEVTFCETPGRLVGEKGASES